MALFNIDDAKNLIMVGGAFFVELNASYPHFHYDRKGSWAIVLVRSTFSSYTIYFHNDTDVPLDVAFFENVSNIWRFDKHLIIESGRADSDSVGNSYNVYICTTNYMLGSQV